MSITIKICGLSDETSVRAANKAGADYAGFVHFPASPRHVTIERAASLRTLLSTNTKSVLVTVDPDDALLKAIQTKLKPDYVQLHGKETPSRIRDIKNAFPGIKIIKAIKVATKEDLDQAEAYYRLADMLLFDAAPPVSSSPNRGEVRRGADKAHHYPIAAILKNARELRKSLTDAEKLLWGLLRSEQLGVKFRKQHPVGEYIADFACLNPKLIIELDGGQHAQEDAIKKDDKRTRFLEQQGFKVMRFWNNDMLQNTEGVMQTIHDYVHSTPRPHPNPPPIGEGGYLPGGNGLSFDWKWLAGRSFALPWILSGGLNAGNTPRALRESGAEAIDVSSGVECALGVKDPELITFFIKAARSL